MIDSELLLNIFFLLLCLGGSAFFAGSETGFISWNPLKVQYLAQRGNIVAKWGLFLIRHSDMVISSLLIGNNVCIIGASLSFIYLLQRLNELFPFDITKIPSLETWFLSPFMALFCEMLPKSVFRVYPFQLTIRSIPLMSIVYILTFPITFTLSLVTQPFSKKKEKESVNSFVTKIVEEMVLFAKEGSKTGEFFRSTDFFIRSALSLHGKKIGDLLLNLRKNKREPLVCDYQDSVGEVKKRIGSHKGVIVYKSNKEVAGFISIKELISLEDKEIVGTYCKPIPILTTEMSLFTFFNSLTEESCFFEIIDSKGKVLEIADSVALIYAAFGL
ncbi:MAG: CNNM domain-containing protein [Chitinispirillaceae bacterium]|nr:CNNM domain-containing protein [Chitinispirillaceae bacterium]